MRRRTSRAKGDVSRTRAPVTRHGDGRARGVAFAYLGIVMLTLVMFTGLAVDLGRAYVVRGNLAKAVDAAALAAARQIGSGTTAATNEANKIFAVNFPGGYLGVTSVKSPPDIDFRLAPDGSNVMTVTSKALLPTTFMRVAGLENIEVAARGQSTRRLVDMALILDHSLSLGSAYPQVQAAAEDFVRNFDPVYDRIALVLFATNTIVADPINRNGRGFDQASILNHIASSRSQDSTATAEALYAGWDQLRSVPAESRSGLRVIVLFTDGSPNMFSGTFQVKQSANAPSSAPLVARTGSLHAYDYPRVSGQGTDRPEVAGLYQTYATTQSPSWSYVPPTDVDYTSGPSDSPFTKVNPFIPNLPLRSAHPNHVSAGIPTAFDLYDPSLPGQRALSGGSPSGYPDYVRNASRAARNLAESIANAARADDRDTQPIRVYTLGLGNLLNLQTADPPETGASILQRIANDPGSTSFDATQPEGRYFFAGDPSQLDEAFRQVGDQLIRISE